MATQLYGFKSHHRGNFSSKSIPSIWDGNTDSKDSLSIDWDTEDELEIESIPYSSSLGSAIPGQEVFSGSGEASSSNGSSSSRVIHHFLGMGFSKDMIVRAMKENGENNIEAILEALLTYSVVENLPQEEERISDDPSISNSERNGLDDLSGEDSFPEDEESTNDSLEKDGTVSLLVEMGYEADEVLTAIDRCGLGTPIAELSDFICAAQMAKEADFLHHRELPREDVEFSSHRKPKNALLLKDKRKLQSNEAWKGKRQRGNEKKPMDQEDDTVCHLPNPMIGFGVPSEPWRILCRTLPKAAVGPPFFYYENVALTPKGVWSTISRFLYDIEPEFVDSKFFCAAARKRGYIHNLPIDNRFQLLPVPPLTIHEAFPSTKKWWPKWDKRSKLNCLLTCVGSAKLTERIRKAVENSDGEPPLDVQKYVLEQCRKWNLVWVGKNKVAPVEPDEMEIVMGFPRNHTRGVSRTERYKALGNTFQVDTVGYHLSVLRTLFPAGINVLSLFSGIGGAEVALHKLGIPLKNVVSVEKSEICQTILQSWWDQTNQKGNLIHIEDVQDVDAHSIAQWVKLFGGFDLVIGGSPCNNLAGGNRVSRDGLEGKQSSLFFDYFRILDLVKSMMNQH
ncbi:DNA (cytosine-5)-methyltransferase DRM2-like [Camellia sinensis]|uniref:DNA (cytosine-5)-methyltransferase DRM2-like n=1 Tax=Camellia sinensis TaxID=4442 RepID=UPI001036B8C6|nr:DNA (cytosine-5)-methyltransferase DRM2-like [Camellia sinensis]